MMRYMCLYNSCSMMGRPSEKEAPPFGQRLAAIRKSKGLTQKQLADMLDTTREMIEYYERRAANPALEIIKSAADVLEVPLVELLGGDAFHTSNRKKPGPTSALDQRVEEIKRLPRKKQQFVIQVLDTLIESARKAS